MTHLVIIVSNKVLCSHNNEVLIPYDGSLDVNLDKWVNTHYSVRVVRKENYTADNFCAVFALESCDQKTLNLISFSNAIKQISKEHQAICIFLESQKTRAKIKLQYGVRDNRIVCISEIQPEQKGLKCSCTCPGCGLPLQARLGDVKQHHFSHNNSSCDATVAQQTALHMLAKELLEEEKKILLPGIDVRIEETSFQQDHYRYYSVPNTLNYRKSKIATCESVQLEKRVSDIIPDIQVIIGGKTCLVEIAVTHFVDQDKLDKIKQIGLPLFEIDLSSLHNVEITRDSIREAILYQADNRSWIYNPLRDRAVQWAEEEYQQLFEEAEQREREEEEKRKQKSLQKKLKRMESEKILEELFVSETYKCRILSLRNNAQFENALRSCTLHKDCSAELPFFFDIPITGEMIFPCDRRIWQALIFDKFIYNRKTNPENRTSLYIKRIEMWLKEYQKEIPIDWRIAPKSYIRISDDHSKTVSLIYDVIKQYLCYIANLGFISDLSYGYGEAEVYKSHSIEPPNGEYAVRLKAAIQSVDIFDPDVNQMLNRLLKPTSSYYPYYEESISSEKHDRLQKQHLMEAEMRKNTYEIGFNSVCNLDFNSDIPIMDESGKRWLLCTQCGQIRREDEMASYGGRGKENKGICTECSRR